MISDESDNEVVVDDEEEDTKMVFAADEEGEIDPARVRDELLDFLDDLSAAEDTGSEEEEEECRLKKMYHHLPWHSRCWRVSCYAIASVCAASAVRVRVSRVSHPSRDH